MFIRDQSIDYKRSVYIALSNNSSRNYTLPFELSSGEYLAVAYDIENDGKLSDGVGYQASTIRLSVAENNRGI